MLKAIQKLSGKNSLKSATVILIVTLLLSNILGLVRDHYLAQKIPATLLDAYYAAFRIPDLIFNLLILGAITASFIPVFTKFLAKKDLKSAWHVANSFLNISAIVIAIALVIFWIIMPYIMPLVVPKFDQEKLNLTINLSRLILISPFLFTLSYIFGSILNSFKRFFLYSLAPLLYNLSIITATIFFADKFNVYAVVYGVLAGALLHMIIQLVDLVRIGYKYKFSFDYKNQDVRRIFYLMIPRAIGLGANQIMLVVYTAIASTLAAGSITAFNLADNIQTMPTVVFGISFATAIFPTLSEHINLGKFQEFSVHIFKSIKAIIYILVPLTIAIILLRAQIVRLILGSGYFGWQETIMTYNTLGMFAISLIAQGVIPVLARAFYALHDTKTPTIVSIISVVCGIVFGFILAPILNVSGLALAFSLASFINAIVLYVLLRKNVKEIKSEEKGIGLYFMKVLFATLVAGIIIQLVKIVSVSFVDMARFWGVATQTILALGLGSLGYFYMAKIVKCQQQEELVNVIKNYLTRNAKK